MFFASYNMIKHLNKMTSKMLKVYKQWIQSNSIKRCKWNKSFKNKVVNTTITKLMEILTKLECAHTHRERERERERERDYSDGGIQQHDSIGLNMACLYASRFCSKPRKMLALYNMQTSDIM